MGAQSNATGKSDQIDKKSLKEHFKNNSFHCKEVFRKSWVSYCGSHCGVVAVVKFKSYMNFIVHFVPLVPEHTQDV